MTKKIETDYDALDSISAVRINTGMFIGDTETPNHLATEVVDNMLDEIANGFAKEGEIFINEEDGSFWVSDTGRGLKIGVSKDPDTGEMKDSIELLCTKLFSGSKFRIDDKVDYAVQIGMHGVGLVVVNALSEWLVIRVRKQTKIYEYIFMDSVFNSKDVFDQTDETFSTQIGFKPNPTYFEQVNFDIKMFVSRLLLTQCVYDNAKFKINDKEIPKISLYDYAKNTLDISKDNKLYQVSKNYGKNEKIRIFLNYFSERDSVVVGDVNLRTCDGTYIANLQTMIKDIISNNIDRKYRSLDDKEFLIGLRLYCSLTLEKPKFDAQIKSRMKTNIKKYLVQIEKDLTKILTQSDIMNTITSMLEQKMTKKIINNASNGKRISSTNKLRDCLQSPGDVLFIVEGDSADGTLKIVRNKKTEASFPLKGKVLNVEKGSLLKIEKNKEVQDLIEAIGPVGKRRYKKIKLLADSDSVSAETPIFYKNLNGYLKWDQIQNIIDISEVQSLNSDGSIGWKKVSKVISHKYTKDKINQITCFHNHVLDCTDDHVIYVYNVVENKIEQKAPKDINIKTDFLIISKNTPILEKNQHIDILDILISKLTPKTKYRMYLKWEDFKNDINDEYVRVDISERVIRNHTLPSMSRMLNINQHTITSYINKCTTKAPLSFVRKLQKIAEVNLDNADITIELNQETKHYLDYSVFGNWVKDINTKIQMSNELAFLIGAYIGDGFRGSSKNNPYEVSFCTGDSELFADIVVDCCEKLNFNEYTSDFSKNSNSAIIKVKSIELDSVLDYFGLTKEIKHDEKFINEYFFSCDENIRASILQGIFYSDGSFFNTGDNRYRLNHSSSSKKLQIDLNFMLNQFGVNSIIQEVEPRKSGFNQRGVQIIGKKKSYKVSINRFEDLEKLRFICDFMDQSDSEDNCLTRHHPPNQIKSLTNFNIIPIKSIKEIDYKYDLVYDLEVEDNNNFTCGSMNCIIHNSDGLHIDLLTILFLNKFALDMIENGQVSILMPPLYGAVKGKTFVPIYKIEDTKKYRNTGYEIRRFKGLGEMNSDQLEVAVRSGVEYVVKYPGKDVVDNIIENVVNNTEVRKKLLLKDVLSFDLILDQATKYAVESKNK